MQYPTISGIRSTRDFTGAFAGYNHNLQIGSGELYDMKNMSTDDFPVLSSRRPRGVYAAPQNANGMIAKDTLCYVDGSAFVMDQYRIEMGLTDCRKTLVSMGAYVIILPDKKYINTADITDFGRIEAEVTTAGNVTFDLCGPGGAGIDVKYHQAAEPEKPVGGEYWLDTASVPHVLKLYSQASGIWTAVGTTYIRIRANGIGIPFRQYDGVEITGLAGVELIAENGEGFRDAQMEALEGSFAIMERGDDFLVIVGMLDMVRTIQNAVTIKRAMPDMDFLIESENRLWGCRYGIAADGQVVNELYASKLGDFRNWECYMGVSTDSYRVSLGSDGRFTGAISHLGHPLFFKEDCIHKVFGNYPANFQVQTTACRGVERESSLSLAVVNEVLYYKSRNGICAYDGSLPQQISGALGTGHYSEAVGGGNGNKYYVSMYAEEGRSLFVYDTVTRLWSKEDDVKPVCFCSAQNELYFIDETDGKIRTVFGSGEAGESTVQWMAQTGVLGIDSMDTKYFPKLSLRVHLEMDAWMEISLEYDDSGVFEPVCHFRSGGKLESFTIPVRPRRCDHMRLRMRGCGAVKIYSITKSVAMGSDQHRSDGTHVYSLDF